MVLIVNFAFSCEVCFEKMSRGQKSSLSLIGYVNWTNNIAIIVSPRDILMSRTEAND